MMNRRKFLERLPLGFVFGVLPSRYASGQTVADLVWQVEEASERIRQQPIESIVEDSNRTAAILSEIVKTVVSELRPGMTTNEIDRAIANQILSRGLLPSMLGDRGFPASSALSISPALLHSPPSEQAIADGDLLTIQVSAASDFSHASLGLTVPIGCPEEEDIRVVNICRQALENAIGKVRPGIRTGEISNEIERSLEADKLFPIRDFVGYTMGQERMQAPQIFGFGPPDRGAYIEAGMILNIHVIGTRGNPRTRIAPDNWTATTRDASKAALATAMVIVDDDGGNVITSIPEMSFEDCAKFS